MPCFSPRPTRAACASGGSATWQCVPAGTSTSAAPSVPGGVRARLAHHRKRAARPHWHVDHLRLHTQLERVWFTHDPVHREHQWAQAIQQLPGAETPLHGFGSSDCACASHLVRFARRPSLRRFQREIRVMFPEHAPIHSTVTA